MKKKKIKLSFFGRKPEGFKNQLLPVSPGLCLLRHQTYLSFPLSFPLTPPKNMTVRIILLLMDITLQYHQGLCSSIQILIFRDSEIYEGELFLAR